MEKIKLLLMEDEANLAMILRDTLEGQDFELSLAADGEEGLKLFFDIHPDIVVADVMMPKMDGFEVVRRIRKLDNHTPVLFLTAKSAVSDVVKGFELGANDYLKKPFAIQELLVRVSALLHRYGKLVPSVEPEIYDLGIYTFNPIQQLLFIPELQEKITLSHRESEILKALCLNKEQVVYTKDLLLELWGDDSFFNTRSLHVFITKLRHKLSKDNHLKIINVRGIGYKLII